MRYRDCMIAYDTAHQPNEPNDRIMVGPWPDTTGWSDEYGMTTGACYTGRQRKPKWQQIALMFTDFHGIVVRDKASVEAAQAAFQAIDEYRQTIAPDISGADRD